MGFQDAMTGWVFDNPIVTNTTDVAKFTVRQLGNAVTTVTSTLSPKTAPGPTVVYMDPLPLWEMTRSGGYFIRLAGLSGASAVALGAYGAHAKFDKEDDEKLKNIFETANKYHFINSLALLGVPLCHYPAVTGSLLLLGMLMFCGTCYQRALTGNNSLRRITPIGGTTLILAWLSMAL